MDRKTPPEALALAPLLPMTWVDHLCAAIRTAASFVMWWQIDDRFRPRWDIEEHRMWRASAERDARLAVQCGERFGTRRFR